MATVYDGNRIGILPGGTTYGADSPGLTNSRFAMKASNGSTIHITGAEAQAALYAYSVGGGDVYLQVALA
jgi:hypothetical protein